MARLNEPQRAALANWWPLVVAEAFAGTTATDTVILASATAAKAGQALAFAEASAIATLYGFARRMANAAGELQGSPAAAVIGPEHIGIPPWARDEQVMLTTPIWHVSFAFTYLDQAGNQITDFRTSVFEMTLPQTIGELAAAIGEDAQALADKYRVELVDAQLHQILAV